MKRIWVVAVLLVALTAVAGVYVPLNFLRPSIERALGRGLGRRVEIGNVYLAVLSGPGFSLDGVTIHEDPRAGIEPFAYVQTLDAHIAPLGLLRGHLNFSSLRFGDASLNLVKTDAGPWNFQFFLEDGPPGRTAAGSFPPDLPSIKMRAGRVNFKFGQTKSVLFFDDADLDVSPGGGGAMELRFSGAPSRTDRSAQNFGHFFLRGTSLPSADGQKLDLKVDLEPSALDAVAHLLAPGGYAAPGIVALNAQITGLVPRLAVTGELQLDQRGGRWRVPCQGTLDVAGQKLDLESASQGPKPPISIDLHARNLLSSPQWEAAAKFDQAPLAAFLDAARRAGITIPDKLSGEGAISGSMNYRRGDGVSGDLEVRDLALSMAGAPAITSVFAAVSMGGGVLSAGPAKVAVGEHETAGVELNYGVADGWDLRITTRGLDVGDLHAWRFGDVPLLDRVSEGSWRGWMRYRKPAAAEAAWSGEYELQNARVAIDGLADPVRIRNAAVTANPRGVSVSRLRAAAGEIEFTGDYQWDAHETTPHHFQIQAASLDVQELARLWTPTLARGDGFLARTLRFGAPPPVPDWLTERQAEGTLTIQALTAGDYTLKTETVRVVWDGPSLKISGIEAGLGDAAISGDLSIDLSGGTAGYRFEGTLEDFAYKGGALDFTGKIESAGAGVELLANLRAEGFLRGRSIVFSPEAEFRNVAGRFEMSVVRGVPRWTLSDLELVQAGETYSGEGKTQADGRLVLELASRGRQVRYTGTLAALAPQP